MHIYPSTYDMRVQMTCIKHVFVQISDEEEDYLNSAK